MNELLVFGVILVVALGLTIPALIWQKKGLAGQQKGLSSVDESLAISRRSIENQERAISNSDEYLRNQKVMIDLLQKILEQQRK